MKTNNPVFLIGLQALLGAGFISAHSWANPAEVPDAKDGNQEYTALRPPKKSDSSIPEPARVMLSTEISKITRAKTGKTWPGCQYVETKGSLYQFCCATNEDFVTWGADPNTPAPDCKEYAQRSGKVVDGVFSVGDHPNGTKRCTAHVGNHTFNHGQILGCQVK